MKHNKIWASLLLALLTSVFAATSSNAAAEIRLRTGLAGATINNITPKGKAEYRERATRQLNVQVENVNLPDGTILNVLAGATQVGQMTLALMRGVLQLNTGDGDGVPAIAPGTSIVVTDQNGDTIVAAVF
jgi:hypothetical protein